MINRATFSAPSTRLIIILLIVVLAIPLLIIAAPRLLAGYALWFSFGSYKHLLHGELGWSDAWASVISAAMAFICALVWVPLTGWTARLLLGRFNLRQILVAFCCWMFVYGASPVLHLSFADNACFNQETGRAEKWYSVVQGQVLLADSPGYDRFGAQRRPVTPRMCQVALRQRDRSLPQLITGDLSKVAFFDSVSGLPSIWYSRAADRSIRLFDAPGFDPQSGQSLSPVNNRVVAEVETKPPQPPAIPADNPPASDTPAPAHPLVRSSVVTPVRWVEKPDPNAMLALYPAAAREAGIAGRATVKCMISADDRLRGCEVVDESPIGSGFGGAALQAAELFRMRPPMRDGVPQSGVAVTIPLSWGTAG